MSSEQVERLFYEEGGNDDDDGLTMNTHFEIGKHLHIEPYYNAKKFFQDLNNSKRIAAVLTDKIYGVYQTLNDTTFIGCGIYSSRFLDETVKRLVADRPELNLNYGIIDNSERDLIFYLVPDVLHRQVILVLPITCTFANITNIERLLNAHYDRRWQTYKIHYKVLSVFLVLDKRVDRQAEEVFIDDFRDDELKRLYDSFQWKSLQRDKVIFKNRHPNGKNYEGYFLFELSSLFLLPEKCKYCFSPDDVSAERTLYPTRKNNDTPDIIFSLPEFSNFEGVIKTDKFEQVKFDVPNNAHLLGNLRIGEHSFLHYIKKDAFYENNKEAILKFFSEHIDLPFPWQKGDRILVLTPKHYKSSRFLEDLLDLDLFSGKDIVVMPVKPAAEFLENFVEDYRRGKDFRVVIYFDYTISSGRTFLKINEYLEHAREGQGIDYLFTLIDRTTAYSKQEIIKKLDELVSKNTRSGKAKFLSFFKLNVPSVDSKNIGNPVEEQNLLFTSLLQECHLDALKVRVGNKLLKGNLLTLEELEAAYGSGVEPEKKKENLLLLHLSHEISLWFSKFLAGKDERTPEKRRFNLSDLNDLLNDNARKFDHYKGPLKRKLGDEAYEDYFRDLIIKVLSRPPFKHYQPIYQAVFEYTVRRLIGLLEKLSSKEKLELEYLNTIKFYIKRSVELNSNFILSEYFLEKVKYLYEEKKSRPLNNSKYFLLQCYKQLVFQNPARAIHLEALINKDKFAPWPIRQSAISLKEALQDEFYQMRRIIKSENIFVLNELKRVFLERLKSEQPSDKDNPAVFSDYVRANYLTEKAAVTPEIRMAQTFLSHSTNKGETPDEKEPVAAMLRTVYLLNRQKNSNRKFLVEIREVLSALCSIIDPEVKYGFFVEFREGAKSGEHNQNIFSVLSDDPENQTSTQKLDKDGLIYNMLRGLRDVYSTLGSSPESEGHIQTFLGVAREGDDVFSFRDTYVRNESGNKRSENERIPISAVLKDGRNGEVGFQFVSNAKMLLLFRLADLEFNEAQTLFQHKGRAVLVISYPDKLFQKRREKDPTLSATKAFTSFVDVERVRLLLLLKEDLLVYLKWIFESNIFIELLKDRRDIEFRRSMEHGLKGYFEAMQALLLPKSYNEASQIALEFIRQIIYSHIKSNNPNSPLFSLSVKPYTKSGKHLADLFNIFMDTPGLARNDVPAEQRDFRIDRTMEIECHPIIYEQVIPELILNMRKYSIDYEGKIKYYEISLAGNVLTFKNSFSKEDNANPAYLKPGGGKEMCNNILKKLSLPPLSSPLESDATVFTIHLQFK